MAAAGLSKNNRAFVSQLNRELPGPFTSAQAAKATGADRARVARLLRHLAEQGWLVRIQRGLYATVPLEAENPESWSVDPWSVAMTALAPGYIGGWTALHHWDLTDQLFGTVVFVTSRPVPRRRRMVGSIRIELRHRPEWTLFGTRRVWREGAPVDISDPERTIVDCLDDPSLGGGIRHTAEALVAYGEGESDWGRLIEYADRLGNGTVFKRLGYLTEALDLADERLAGSCLERLSAGTSKLDPARPAQGPTLARWRLQINARVER